MNRSLDDWSPSDILLAFLENALVGFSWIQLGIGTSSREAGPRWSCLDHLDHYSGWWANHCGLWLGVLDWLLQRTWVKVLLSRMAWPVSVCMFGLLSCCWQPVVMLGKLLTCLEIHVLSSLENGRLRHCQGAGRGCPASGQGERWRRQGWLRKCFSGDLGKPRSPLEWRTAGSRGIWNFFQP